MSYDSHNYMIFFTEIVQNFIENKCPSQHSHADTLQDRSKIALCWRGSPVEPLENERCLGMGVTMMWNYLDYVHGYVYTEYMAKTSPWWRWAHQSCTQAYSEAKRALGNPTVQQTHLVSWIPDKCK